MATLIPSPVLDDRDEVQIAAEMIARVSGGLALEAIDKGVAVWLRLREMVLAGAVPVAASPELTNASPASPHTGLLEAMSWLAGLQSYKLNRVPEKVMIEFHRLFGIELREGTAATVTLTFTARPPAGFDVAIPAGTIVQAEAGDIAFQTDAELVLPYSVIEPLTGTVSATRTVLGFTQLAPGTLTRLVDSIAFVTAVTNADAVESGSEDETVASALARARDYQLVGEHVTTARDLEARIFNDVLLRRGVVKSFDLIEPPDWTTTKPGHATLVVMTPAGNPVGAEVKQAVYSLLAQTVGHIAFHIEDPHYIAFDVAADVRMEAFTTQVAVKTAIKANLQSFYAPSPGNFGRKITRSKITEIIEGTNGVNRIEPQPDGAVLATPAGDTALAPYELPRLVNITINVVS